MNKTRVALRRWLVAAGAMVLVIAAGYFGLREYEKSVLAKITVREATGTVRGTDHLRFDEANRSRSY